MLEFIKNRTTTFITGTILLIVLGTLLALQGCNLADTIKVDVPQYVKTAIADQPEDLERQYTYADADYVIERWQTFVHSNNERLLQSVEDAQERYELLRSLTDLGYGALQQEVSSLPGGALLVSALSLVTGIFMKRPGEDSRVAKEKRDSYNKGLEVGAGIATKPAEEPAAKA